MRSLVVIVVAAMTLSVAACGGDDDDTSNDASDQTAVPEGEIPDVIGSTVEDATATLEEAGMTLRVVRRDGEDLAATMDFVENRVNVAVETQGDGSEVVTEVISTG